MSLSLCKYRDVLGVPKQGVHSYRLFDVAIIDVIFTFIGAFLISRVFKVSFLWSCVVLFTLGIILHHIFCVRTTVDKFLFPDRK